MMNKFVAIFSVLFSAIVVACGDSTVDPANNKATFAFYIEARMGFSTFALESIGMSDNGVAYTVSKLRFYISSLRLVDSLDREYPLELIDSAGKNLDYNLTLIDFSMSAPQIVRVRAPVGMYKGIKLNIGVPETLNHVDASVMNYPLNVDADMYWSWNPGYIFLKIEGTSNVSGTWKPYFFHVGDSINCRTVVATSTSGLKVGLPVQNARTLTIDVNRLFVTPSGVNNPDIGGTDREVMTGPSATQIMINASSSGFITLKD